MVRDYTSSDGFSRFIGENEPDAPKKDPELKSQYSIQNKHSHMTTEDPVYSHHVWRRYASPVWMDIRQSDTLQRKSARDERDERHICPLQIEVIKRAIELWTNPDDIVFSPFAGIGSEIYSAIQLNRRGLGIELKESYYQQAVLNCKQAELDIEREVDGMTKDEYKEWYRGQYGYYPSTTFLEKLEAKSEFTKAPQKEQIEEPAEELDLSFLD
jgi:DNA modification methylase